MTVLESVRRLAIPQAATAPSVYPSIATRTLPTIPRDVAQEADYVMDAGPSGDQQRYIANGVT